MEIKTFKPADHKIKALVYGRSGSGKTMFGGTAPKPLILSAENGLLSLASSGLEVDSVEIKTLKDLKDALAWLKMPLNQGKYETLVIDSISEINEIIKEELQARLKRRMQLQDWGVLADEIKMILRSMKSLPMHVLYIAQEKDITDGENIDKKVPMLNGMAATSICYDVDIVGYIEIQKDGSRVIITNAHPKLLTKDRSNMIGNDDEINFSNWCEKIKSVQIGTSKIVVDYTDAKNSNANPPRNDVITVNVPSTPNKKENTPEGKKNTILHKKMHATWNDYVKAAKIEKQRAEPTRIATLQKVYGVSSSLDLTDDQIEDFCKRLNVKIEEMKPKAPVSDSTPTDIPPPEAQAGIDEQSEKVNTLETANIVFNKNSPAVIHLMENYAFTEKEAILQATEDWNVLQKSKQTDKI